MSTLSALNDRIRDLTEAMARTADELAELADRNDAGAVQRRVNVMRHGAKLEAEYGEVLAQRNATALDGVRSGRFTTEAGYDPGDFEDEPTQRPSARGTFPLGGGTSRNNTRGEALRAIERSGEIVPDAAKQRFTTEVERATGEHFDRLTAWATATADPAYLRAFLRLAGDPSTVIGSSPPPSSRPSATCRT